jgi:hypothetical protein
MDFDRMNREMQNGEMMNMRDDMEMNHDENMFMHPELVNMINNCEVTCEHMTHHLVMMRLASARMAQFGLLRDCSDICGLTARSISRGSYFSKVLADVCAEVCNACGNECLRYPDDMSQHCGKICIECAKHCRRFARG